MLGYSHATSIHITCFTRLDSTTLDSQPTNHPPTPPTQLHAQAQQAGCLHLAPSFEFPEYALTLPFTIWTSLSSRSRYILSVYEQLYIQTKREQYGNFRRLVWLSSLECQPFVVFHVLYIPIGKHYALPCDKHILECDTLGTISRSSILFTRDRYMIWIAIIQPKQEKYGNVCRLDWLPSLECQPFVVSCALYLRTERQALCFTLWLGGSWVCLLGFRTFSRSSSLSSHNGYMIWIAIIQPKQGKFNNFCRLDWLPSLECQLSIAPHALPTYWKASTTPYLVISGFLKLPSLECQPSIAPHTLSTCWKASTTPYLVTIEFFECDTYRTFIRSSSLFSYYKYMIRRTIQPKLKKYDNPHKLD